MKLDVIYNKSCQRMSELPDGSIDMCLSSPPYWGLRDYGEDVKEIWGGDPDCEHDFIMKTTEQSDAAVKQGPRSIIKQEHTEPKKWTSGFCKKCNAWHGQLGLEPTFQLYLDHMMIVCAEIKRVLKKTGSFWLNMGDTYGGSCAGHGDTGLVQNFRRMTKEHLYNTTKPQRTIMAKCLIGIPWRLILRLIDEQGWILRNAITWHKPNAMPSSVKDRCSNSYEFLFHLVKAKKYYYDLDAIREPSSSYNAFNRRVRDVKRGYIKSGQYRASEEEIEQYHGKNVVYNPAGKNPSDVWTIPTQPRPEAHFATFPDKLCIKPILATCPAEICKKCGKARVRISKTSYEQLRKPGKWRDRNIEGYGRSPQATKLGVCRKQVQTIGWTDCGCNAGWDSGVLLDPFAGRGTSLIMAKKLGRHYVGYELKKEYADMAERELEEVDPLFRRR